MRTITETHTGKIISDTDLTLEYLYVGDYGKENNIKASFLGYDKRIDKVKHKDINIEDLKFEDKCEVRNTSCFDYICKCNEGRI